MQLGRMVESHDLSGANLASRALTKVFRVHCLGRVRLAQGVVPQARGLLQEALEINAQIGTRAAISISLETHVQLFIAEGRLQEAARCAGIQDAVFAAMQSELPPVLRNSLKEAVNSMRSQLSHEEFHSSWQEGQTLSDPAAIATSYALPLLALTFLVTLR